MIKLLISASAFALLFAIGISAQSVVITPKKTVYKRPKPISEYKRTFTVTYPKVKAATPALSKKIEVTISYAKNLDLNVQEEMGEIQWLEDAEFEVNYNARAILVITLWIEGSGAYPDGTSKTVAVDLRTGNRILPSEAFTDLKGLVAKIKQKQKVEIEASIKDLREDPEEKDTDPAELFAEEEFKVANLSEFAVDAKGVTFIYDYGFPHAIKALEPEGRYTYSWAEIAKFVKPQGPLWKFIVK